MHRILLALTLLWPLAAHAAAPTVSNTGTCTGEVSSTTVPCSITTTGTNKIVVITTATSNNSSTVSAVTSITDNGAAGWTFVKAPNASVSLATTCNGGVVPSCALDLEEWWALAATAKTSESVTVNFNHAALASVAGWKAVGGVFDTTAPFDGNVSLAATNTGGSATVPTMGSLTTSSTDDLLVNDVLVGQNVVNYAPCLPSFAVWATSFADFTFTAQLGLNERVLGVTSAQTGLAAHNAVISGSCPAGTATTSGTGWVILSTAMNGTAPPVLGGSGWTIMK